MAQDAMKFRVYCFIFYDSSSNREDVFRPVVMRLGNHRDDVLDLLFQPEGRTSRQEEHGSLATDADIFYYNGTQQPQSHLLGFTSQSNPPQCLTAHNGQSRDQAKPTLNLGEHALVSLQIRSHLFWRDRFQQGISMRWTSCQGQITEIAPNFIPGHFPIVCVAQWSR